MSRNEWSFLDKEEKISKTETQREHGESLVVEWASKRERERDRDRDIDRQTGRGRGG